MEIKIDSAKEIKLAKSALRKQVKAQIADFACNAKKIREASNKISDNLFNSELYKNASLIFCFISCNDEVNTKSIILKSLDDNKNVVVPKIVDSKMQFYFLQNIPLEKQTEIGAYNILEPKNNLLRLDEKKIKSKALKNALLIFPGLAFDKTGNRLGKGKGFYDYYFEVASIQNCSFSKLIKRVGVCYSIQIKEKIPTEINDIKMQFLITENGIIECC